MHFKIFSLIWRVAFVACTLPLFIGFVQVAQWELDPVLMPLFWLYFIAQAAVTLSAIAILAVYCIQMGLIFTIYETASRLVSSEKTERRVYGYSYQGMLICLGENTIIADLEKRTSPHEDFTVNIRLVLTHNALKEDFHGKYQPVTMREARTLRRMLRKVEEQVSVHAS